MNADAQRRCRILSLAVIGGVFSLILEGCAYRLPPVSLPSQERFRVIATAPERYVVHLDVDHSTDYPVPADGRVILGITPYRPTCGVYLFNAIKVGGGVDPSGTWSIAVTSGGKTLRKLSVKQARKLPTDVDGYRLLEVKD